MPRREGGGSEGAGRGLHKEPSNTGSLSVLWGLSTETVLEGDRPDLTAGGGGREETWEVLGLWERLLQQPHLCGSVLLVGNRPLSLPVCTPLDHAAVHMAFARTSTLPQRL